jgi:hypothetical protein
MRRISRLSALLGAALAASPAAAVDSLTGVWRGKLVCVSTNDTTTEPRQKADATVFVEDLGGGAARVRVNNLFVLPIPSTIVSGADVPERARIAGVGCGFDADAGGLVLQASAKVKPDSPKGTMTGEFINFAGGVAPHFVSICTFKVKREETTLATPIGDCPP